MRVPQWVKNGLLVIAPAASGTLWHRHVLANTLVAFVAFCLVASSLYILNDLKDVESDRAHPTKRFRAIAAGDLSRGAALASSAILALLGFTAPVLIEHPAGFYLILGLYVTETLCYILWLKNAVIIELGQRAAELRHVGSANRAVLTQYTTDFLHSALTLSATVVVTAYCLWAIDTSSTGLSSIKHDVILVRLSMVPVVLAILFIIRGAESGEGESPEDLLLKNRTVQVLALVWLVLIAWGTYL